LNTLEIILPLRNPTAVLEQTAKSLATQTDRNFTVLLSDNHSTQGAEFMDAAVHTLEASGIAVRRVRPPTELGRVEHWNWTHYESQGEWLKPLFAGDWLEPDYVAELRAAVAANPQCRYVFVPYVLHLAGHAPQSVISPWAGRFRPAKEMADVVLRCGMQFGPPSAAAFERTMFFGTGGYPTTLPISADSLLFCTMAMRHGALGLSRPLCHFNIHGARFSTTLPQKRRATLREAFTYYYMLAYHAWSENVMFSKIAFARMVLREARAYWFKK
jgi:hypothetical protein